MSIYVGNKDVTGLLREYFTGKGTKIDGRVEGQKEIGDYTAALNSLQLQAVKENPKDKAAIINRYNSYRELIKKGCGKMGAANPLLQGIYEELTQYIESGVFDKLPKPLKLKVAALQAEMFSILSQTGKHRGAAMETRATGTAAEAAKQNPPSEPFRAHPKVLANVPKAIKRINLEQCAEDMGSAKEDTSDLNIYGETEKVANPLPTKAFREEGDKVDVNTDLRGKSKPATSSVPMRRPGGAVF